MKPGRWQRRIPRGAEWVWLRDLMLWCKPQPVGRGFAGLRMRHTSGARVWSIPLVAPKPPKGT